LLEKGVGWQKASSYALNVFPPEGSSLDSVTKEILADENITMEVEEELPLERGEGPMDEMKVEEEPKSQEYQQREQDLRNLFYGLGVDWSVATSFPYSQVIDQFLNGKGTPNVLFLF
jgi:hypothetical protein